MLLCLAVLLFCCFAVLLYVCLAVFSTPAILEFLVEKSRIRETKHLLTDADSSTDAIGGWTKNTQKPDFF